MYHSLSRLIIILRSSRCLSFFLSHSQKVKTLGSVLLVVSTSASMFLLQHISIYLNDIVFEYWQVSHAISGLQYFFFRRQSDQLVELCGFRPVSLTDFISINRFFPLKIWQTTDFLGHLYRFCLIS